LKGTGPWPVSDCKRTRPPIQPRVSDILVVTYCYNFRLI
jgi:hypothetical protein